MTKKVTFKNRRGQKMVGDLYLPKGNPPFPAVVKCHGLSTKRQAKSTTWMANKLNKAGFLFFSFDFTGHGDSAGKLENVTPSKAAEDALAALRFIKKSPEVDKKRIGLFGSSYGGHAALIAAGKDQSVKVLALRSPAADYAEVRYYQLGDFGIEAWRKLGIMYVSHRKDRKGYILKYNFYKNAQKNNTYKWIPKIKASTIVIQGDQDDYVPVSQSKKIYDLLKVKNKKRVVIKDCDHHYVNPKHKTRMFNLIASWFKKYL